MYTRHLEVPAYSRGPAQIQAPHYNIVQRALIRKPDGLRLSLPGLRTLDLIVLGDAWVIVDCALNDLPVAAWSDFEIDAGRALHEPIVCELAYFHAHAGMIIKQVLELMDDLLDTELKDGDDSHQVIDFPQKEE
ncbi:hypothetical protein V5T82_12335 [Magnetovibrio sp. PR-2]|uniref:hypothetical protein n=1 Tax=Magnetovibrio sp. PR-2 TaxID=3120356 RepID=UPI002FCDF0FA